MAGGPPKGHTSSEQRQAPTRANTAVECLHMGGAVNQHALLEAVLVCAENASADSIVAEASSAEFQEGIPHTHTGLL